LHETAVKNWRAIVVQTVLAGIVWSNEATSAGPFNEGKETHDEQRLRAGACAIDVAPMKLPVLVNGGFLQNQATRVNDPIRAKCLVLDDGAIRLAIVVVDICMMPRELIDRAKDLAREKTGIPVDRMLVSATHTHSAPAAMGALGCPADQDYVALLPGRIAEAIEGANRNLEPARIGWGAIDDDVHTFCRRWIWRPDKVPLDPFGQKTVRANMHPGYQNPDVIGPAGPVDPGLTVLSVQSRAGRPIAVLANYSMHYFGAEPISADYFGRFSAVLAKRIRAETVNPPFVGIMSQGTSGDQMWMDYGQAKKDLGLDAYATEMARAASKAYDRITYHDWVPLAMAETKLVVHRRSPDPARLAWANAVVAKMGDKGQLPRTLPEVYAKEALFLHEDPERTLKLQAIRIGELGLTAIPNEVFAITGLKLKAQSPFATTMNIELANGSEGYIPPPEQHALGGYTTWPARTAGLEVQAEPRIVETVLSLLEQVAGKPRRALSRLDGAYAKSVLKSHPMAYWRLDDIQGSVAFDSTNNNRPAAYEGGRAFYLPGVNAPGLSAGNSINRAVHFAGGILDARLETTSDRYSVELWFWNGLAADVRPITGVIFARGSAKAGTQPLDQLGIGGTQHVPNRLFYSNGRPSKKILTGKTEIIPKSWHHLVLVRDHDRVAVYLDASPDPDIAGLTDVALMGQSSVFSVAGDLGGLSRFEGKIDELAIYDRVLPAGEIAEHARAASSFGDTGDKSRQ
jgi:Concanavalin A-like lectin/glucanases superfamily